MSSNTVVCTTITPERAATILAETGNETQRHLRQHHVTFLADEMRRGRFKQRTLIVIGWDKERGRHMLLDGQHRLMAVVKSDLPQEFLISYEDYQSTDSARRAYTVIDQGMRRTPYDKFSALGLTDRFGMSAELMNKFAAACKFIMMNFGSSKVFVHDDDLVGMMNFYAAGCQMYHDDIYNKAVDRPAMLRAATLGVVLPCYTSPHREKARVFWTGAASGFDMGEGDLRMLAFRHIISTGMPGRTHNKRKMVRAAYSARYLARCYSLWMVGEQRSFVKIEDETGPMFIFGTPYNGKSPT